MNLIKKTTYFLALFLLVIVNILFLTPAQTQAASGSSYTLLEPLPCVNGTTADTQTPNCVGGKVSSFEIDYYIKYAFRLAIALAAFAAVVMFTYGGFEYMMSETSVSNQKTAKDRMQNAILGLLAVLSSYVILNTIDPRLVNVTTTIPPLKLNDASSINFSDLNEQLGQQARAVLKQVADANIKIDELNKKISNLNDELVSATSSENYDQIELQIEETFNERNLIQGQTALAVGKTLINQLVEKQQNNVDEVIQVKNKIITTYTEQQRQIIESGQQNLLEPLTTIKNYAIAVEDVYSKVAVLKTAGAKIACEAGWPSDRLKKVTLIMQSQKRKLESESSRADSITDPVLKTQFQEKLNSALSTVNTYQLPSCSQDRDRMN